MMPRPGDGVVATFRPLSSGAMATIVLVGVPTALGGHAAGMERTPAGLRELGVIDALRAAPELAEATLRDAGDLRIEPGFAPDKDRRAKNRAAIAEFLPREARLVGDSLAGAGADARLLVLGGDCTAHAGAIAGIRRARPGGRIALAWFDAHGDFNTPDTTPSGNVWGMPFAMICGRGDRDLVTAADGPTVRLEDAALLGGQVLDEQESRDLAASPIAHFGAGMLATDAGLDALGAWATAVGRRVDGFHIAFDMDVLDAAGDWAVQMPEPNGLSLATAVEAITRIRAASPVLGFGPTGVNLGHGDPPRTVDAIVALTVAAIGEPAISPAG
jgi:arginase